MITIHENDCTGCRKCVMVCPTDALYVEDRVAKLREELCISCSACVTACPVDCIEPVLKSKKADFSDYSGVWVFAEQNAGELKPTGPQLLGKGRELANELGEELCAVLLGDEVKDLAEELASYGAEKVYVIEHKMLENYTTEAYTTALVSLISKYKPNIFLYGATHLGRDLTPSVAGHLGLGLTADCTGLSIEEIEGEEYLLQTRPAFGGNVMADIICPNTRPQMTTVRPHVMKPIDPIDDPEYELIDVDVKIESEAIKTEILEILEPEKTGEISVEEADIVISGGRGVGTPENFELLKKLADLLGGTIGCSRPIVEEDVMPKSRQVGQSGKTISPDVYFACGISGAIQHKVGVRGSNTIIAINKDPHAPIFDIADIGIVGDFKEIVPILIERLKNKEK